MDAIIDYRGKSPDKTLFGIPLITAKVVKNGRILLPDEFIAPAQYDTWMRRGLPLSGDVVMTTEAPLGEVAQLDGTKVALAQRLITLRGKANVIDNKFLKFLMQSAFVQQELRARATGTTVLGIRQSELRKATLPIPPLSEQRAISEVLGALDDKIALNRRMNETLESIARAIFKSWFVDFDPVHAKTAGHQPRGMSADIAALFPSKFIDSPLGKIPAGWRSTSLGAEADRNGGAIQTGPFGSQLHASDYVTQGVPVVMPQDIESRRVSTMKIARVREFDAESRIAAMSRAIFLRMFVRMSREHVLLQVHHFRLSIPRSVSLDPRWSP